MLPRRKQKRDRVYSQLIEIDFTRAERYPDFQDLTGFTTDTVSYYRSELFELFAAHLFNYERWGSRPLFEMAFRYADEYQYGVKLDERSPYTQAIDELVKELTNKYAAWAKAELVVITHRDRLTICGFNSAEKYPDVGMKLAWLMEPIEEKDNAQPSSREDIPPTPNA